MDLGGTEHRARLRAWIVLLAARGRSNARIAVVSLVTQVTNGRLFRGGVALTGVRSGIRHGSAAAVGQRRRRGRTQRASLAER